MKPDATDVIELTPETRAMLDRVDASAMLRRTLEWSAIQTGTGNLAGLGIQTQALADAFSALPGEVRLEAAAPVSAIDADGREVAIERGRNVVLSVRPTSERRILLTGHMDTVFPADTSFVETTEPEPGVLNGPGLADMKGGLSVILEALTMFEGCDAAQAIGYDVMINSDEETGSAGSAALIERLARGKLAALTYEPSTESDGTFAGARGGSGNYSVIVTGRSAHAGRNPQDGRNAIVAAADIAVRLAALAHADLPINPARIEGGAANNVVPDHAVLRFNIRPRTTAAAERFVVTLRRMLDEVAIARDVGVHLHGGISRPPKPVDQRAARLFETVRECSERLGLHYARKDSGGVCDGNNIAACGIPVVDTMGVRGGSIHSHQEFMIVDSLAERAQLSALVLHRLATGALDKGR
ncbi:hydrolase [Croceicoccus ponticola]|uniref:Hydrolase n=1 Tax=Croceicoccus ponticola TaxID=2217664 RepID=A0A437GWZ5_9SPHN|nr:hydrolase [Croceicoccus ponticola]RVQ66907.1 hydrolase [Croceicoccus ponticola]